MNLDNYYVLAINHKATEVQNIGDFTVNPDEYNAVVKTLSKSNGVEEVVYLSTCNRVEIWIYANGRLEKNQLLNQVFSGHCFGKFLNVKKDFFELKGDLALLHMVNVACSLDSMVVGERQIFGQLRKAFVKARELGVCGKNLNLAFRKITEVSKAVYSKTTIANQKVSVASIACHELRKLIPEVESTSVSLIGAGETIQLVSKYLVNHQFESVKVLNRTKENGQKIVDIISGTKIGDFNKLSNEIENTDVIISCTGSTEPIITKDKINPNMSYKILDLAVPADTSSEVQLLPNVNFIGVNDLKEIAKQNIKERLQDLNIAASIAQEGWEDLIQFIKEREVVHKTKNVHDEIDAIFKTNELLDQMVCFNKNEFDLTLRMLKYLKVKLNKVPAKISKEILIQKNA